MVFPDRECYSRLQAEDFSEGDCSEMDFGKKVERRMRDEGVLI